MADTSDHDNAARSDAEHLSIGDWTAERRRGVLRSRRGERQLEPKVMELLFLLGSQPGRVFSHAEILAKVWPGVTVGEDSLSRAIFKLRRALGDDPRKPRYIQTIPRRGYRLIGEAAGAPAPGYPAWRLWAGLAVAVLLVAVTAGAGALMLNARSAPPGEAETATARADDYYFQITRADNEAAIALYERALTERPGYAPAQAGLANALVQKVLRWSGPPGEGDAAPTNLGAALESGATRTPVAVQRLTRARGLAESAVRSAPRLPAAWKALGFVKSAQGDLDGAVSAHARAVELDPDAWDALINLADLHGLKGDREEALRWMERSYDAMGRAYAGQASRIRPWHAATGVLIGREHQALGRADQAELWFRRVLVLSPFDPSATAALAQVLAAGGEEAEARRLCADLKARTGAAPGCLTGQGAAE